MKWYPNHFVNCGFEVPTLYINKQSNNAKKKKNLRQPVKESIRGFSWCPVRSAFWYLHFKLSILQFPINAVVERLNSYKSTITTSPPRSAKCPDDTWKNYFSDLRMTMYYREVKVKDIRDDQGWRGWHKMFLNRWVFILQHKTVSDSAVLRSILLEGSMKNQRPSLCWMGRMKWLVAAECRAQAV